MNAPIPPELFAQRPVRSELNRERKPTLRIGRVIFLVTVLIAFIGAGYAVSAFLGGDIADQGPVHVQAEGPLKERPENPGGIEIPHQDVEIFERLDDRAPVAAKSAVEHLLPPPEEPRTEELPAVVDDQGMQAVAPTEDSQKTVAPEGAEVAISSESPVAVVEPVAPSQDTASAPVAPEQVPVAPVVAEQPVVVPPAPEAKPEKPPEVVKAPEKGAPSQPPKVQEAMARLPKELFTGEPVPQTSSSGTKTSRVQFASVPDEGAAGRDRAALAKKFGAQLSGVQLELVRADIPGKGIYYRIMTERVDDQTAREICRAVKEKKGTCFVSK